MVGILVGVPVTGTAIVKCNRPRTELVDFAVTNWTDGVAHDCNGGDAACGDGVGTIIKELIAQGILSGAVAA